MEREAREKAEANILGILNKALRQVPFVRLDAVESVTESFQSALDYMEAHLDVGDSEDEGEFVTPSANADPSIEKTRLGLLASAATQSNNSSNNQSAQPLIPPPTIATKLIGSTVTRDYSSPSQSKRSLGGKRNSMSGPSGLAGAAPALNQSLNQPINQSSGSSTPKLGLGLKASAAASSMSSLSGPAKGALGIASATAHKPSSRAAAALHAASTDEDVPDVAYSSGASSGQSSDNDDEVIRVARPLNSTAKNVLLSRAAGLSSAREYPSPKLGPRSLGASPAGMGPRGVSAPNKHAPIAIGQSASNASPPSELNSSTSAPADLPSSSSSDDASSSNSDEPSLILTEPGELGSDHELSTKEALNLPEDEEKDLVDQALEKSADPLAKLKNEVVVPVTASPKQFKSSIKLLSLAAKSVEDGEDIPLGATGIALSSLPTGTSSPASSSPYSTPKPAYLRRLDSPESHHGQLIAAKAKLSMIINRAVQTIPNLKGDALAVVQQKLEAALAKLEQSTVQP